MTEPINHLITTNCFGHYQRQQERAYQYQVKPPLRTLIESIPPMLWHDIKGITLHPDLGFTSRARFNNLEQLYQWLGGRSQTYNTHNLPYLNWKIARFNKTLNIEDLRPHCAQFPAPQLLKKFGINE
ncbi:hypothetical protein GCM10009347_26520 [Shewanella algicola]|uniref:Uncharacterized protein n=1 Tax=Shewanella algicola TaxID=640633 RepID=A0A9X2CBB3_9GAMM|nr:hypothetical protein [Shewanella algicola]MCL1106374.1 hypothetical protein [Shewanella algicola]GGP58817.1 hypothetical protein GCM10009347_26520 [Shewanella algicola]